MPMGLAGGAVGEGEEEEEEEDIIRKLV